MLFLLKYGIGEFETGIGKYGEIVNGCIGNFLIEKSVEHMLEFNIADIEDGDVFVLGFGAPSDSDTYENRKEKFLSAIRRIEYKYPNCKIVLVTIPPNRNVVNREGLLKDRISFRDSVSNKKSIFHFCVDDSMEYYNEKHGFRIDMYAPVAKQLNKSMESIIDKLKTPRIEMVKCNNVMEFGKNKYVEIAVKCPEALDKSKVINRIRRGDNPNMIELENKGSFAEYNKRIHILTINDLNYIEIDSKLEVVGCRKVNF
jgi:hypothetical protein